MALTLVKDNIAPDGIAEGWNDLYGRDRQISVALKETSMPLKLPYMIAGFLVLLAGSYLLWNGSEDRPVPPGIVSGNGRLEAVQIDVSTKIAGRIAKVLKAEGALVRPDDVLAHIDSAELQAKLRRAEAEVASAQSQVAQANAQVIQVQAQLELAERELNRAKRLVDQGHTSQEVYDTRLSNRDVARANLAATKALVVSRERSVDAARAAKAELDSQLADTLIRAPTTGRVLYRLTEPGEVLPSGGKVMTLVNLTDVYMEIFLPAADAHRLAIGSAARIVIDGTDFAVPAKVTFVSPQAQFTPKQVETKSEREKLMFRVKVRVPPQLVERHIDLVKTGIRGVAFVRPGLEPPAWPAWLEKRFEPPGKPGSEAAK